MLWIGCGPAVAIESSGASTGAQSTTSTTSVSTDSSTTVQGSTAEPSTTGSVSTTTTGFASSGNQTDTVVGDDGWGGFITDPDGGSADGDCWTWDDDIWCARDEECKPWSNDGGTVWNATRCLPVPDDPALIGDSCLVEDHPVSGWDNCEAGSMCFGADPKSLQGTCAAFCSGSPDIPTCADPGTMCVIGNDDAVAVCLPTCDPAAQNCANGDVCVGNYPEQGGFFCIPPGTPYVNDAGVQPGACVAGQVGVSSDLVGACVGDEPCCTGFCDPSQPDPCGAGLECTLWTPEGMCPGLCDEAVCLSPV